MAPCYSFCQAPWTGNEAAGIGRKQNCRKAPPPQRIQFLVTSAHHMPSSKQRIPNPVFGVMQNEYNHPK